MHERALRTVLLVRALEESDPGGEVLPLADREEATRVVMRETQGPSPAGNATLTSHDERLLATRAERLRERVESRAPIVGQLLALAGGSALFGRAVLLLAFVMGAALSALDGSRRINILAFPLIGLIAWNLLVYVALIAHNVRSRTGRTSGSPFLAGLYERWVRWRTEGLLSRSSHFNAPLATALRRFASDWAPIAQPLLLLRAKRLFHLAAAFVAIGLVVGLYVRGIALRYEAGWESTFLGPASVRGFLLALYGPAAAISGIPLPATAEQVSALRWQSESGGAGAAPWIHLIALTAVLYIILPRLIAAFANTLALWRAARRPEVPQSLHRYARLLIGGPDALRSVVKVLPYSYQPSADSIAGLEQVLAEALDGPVDLQLQAPLVYGEEDAIVAPAGEELRALLFSLAATPESENHGAAISAMREGAGKLLIVVDEAPLVARMSGEQARLAERRELWRKFIAGHGLRACITDLARIRASGAAAQMREALEIAQ